MASLSDAVRNAALDAGLALVNGGSLRIYEGSAPADPDSGIGASTLLAQLALSNPAFNAASGGSAVADTISDDTSANATGTAQWAALVDSGGNLELVLTVGTSGTEVVLNTTSIVASATVSCSSCTISQPTS